MLAKIHVDDEARTRSGWSKATKTLKTMPLKELGELVHENRGCATCHSLDGTRGQGPSWKGIWGQTHQLPDGSSAVVDENYIRQSILEPQAHVVQGYEADHADLSRVLLRDREILGVIEFIKTLK